MLACFKVVDILIIILQVCPAVQVSWLQHVQDFSRRAFIKAGFKVVAECDYREFHCGRKESFPEHLQS